MNFFKKLIDGNDTMSSKRFISLVALCLIILVVFKSVSGIIIQPEIIYALITLILGQTTATIFEKNNTPNAN